MRRYALVGAGAVGGLYAGRLAAAGHELHVLARSDAAHLRAHGLIVESPGGDLHVHPVVHTDPTTIPPVDVVIVGLKTTSNDALRGLLGPLAGPGTTVVVLQNGLGVEADAAAAAPGATVLGGLCFVCAAKEGPGHVRHLDYGGVTLAQHSADGSAAGITRELQAVADDMSASGSDITTDPDLVAARWRKLVWNVPYNGLTVVLDAGTEELMADPSARALVRSPHGRRSARRRLPRRSGRTTRRTGSSTRCCAPPTRWCHVPPVDEARLRCPPPAARSTPIYAPALPPRPLRSPASSSPASSRLQRRQLAFLDARSLPRQ